MVDRNDVGLEQPANERAGAGDAMLPSIVALELMRHRADHAHTDETVAARAESFIALMRAFFARKV
jgi:hypothetical protein